MKSMYICHQTEFLLHTADIFQKRVVSVINFTVLFKQNTMYEFVCVFMRFSGFIKISHIINYVYNVQGKDIYQLLHSVLKN